MPKHESHTIKGPFVFDESVLSDIEELFSEIHGEVKGGHLKPDISIECSDGTRITENDFSCVKKFPNLPSRRIEALTFRTDYSAPTRVEIKFDGNLRSNIECDIEGPEQKVSYVSDRVWEIIEAALPSYRWAYRRLLSYVIGRGWFGATVIVAAVLVLNDHFSFISHFPSFATPRGYKTIALLWTFFPLWFGVPGVFFLRFLIHPALFSINHGKSLARHYETRRQIVLITVLLGLGLGLVVAYLSKLLF